MWQWIKPAARASVKHIQNLSAHSDVSSSGRPKEYKLLFQTIKLSVYAPYSSEFFWDSVTSNLSSNIKLCYTETHHVPDDTDKNTLRADESSKIQVFSIPSPQSFCKVGCEAEVYHAVMY